MAAKQEQAPKFGNWETAESVPYTQYFEQARGKRRESTTSDHKQNSRDTAKYGPPKLNAEIKKPKDSKTSRDDGNYHRHDAPSVSNEGVARRSPVNLNYQKQVDQSKAYGSSYEGKPADRARGNPPPSERRVASEGGTATPGRIRGNPGDRVHRTPLRDDVTVPPFAGWDESDPASGEKYTGIFKTIADNRRTPGTPYQPPEPSGQQQGSTGAKGFCCLCWFTK